MSYFNVIFGCREMENTYIKYQIEKYVQVTIVTTMFATSATMVAKVANMVAEVATTIYA